MTIYRNEVTANHVGARVTVRHMVPADLPDEPRGSRSSGQGASAGGGQTAVRSGEHPDDVADAPAGRQVPTDVVGELVGADDSHWQVRRRSGEVVSIDVATVIASKLLPPAPRRRRPRGGATT